MTLKYPRFNRKDKYNLTIILIFSLILCSYYAIFNINLGIYCSDVYVYLLNAQYYTGTNVHSTYNIFLSPVICFLTSILFNLGLKNKIAIIIVTSAFAIIGNLGLYLLLKTRFDEIYSLCGVILYATFAINLTWLSNGSLDIPAASIIILTMLSMVFSVKSNPKYYIVIFPLMVIGIFTRYTFFLVLPAFALYYIYHKGFKIDKNDLKYIMTGLLIGVVIAIIILTTISTLSEGNLGFFGQISGGVGGAKGAETDPAYNTDVTYYIANYLNFISSSKVTFVKNTPYLENPTINSILILTILGLGLILFSIKQDFKQKNKIIPVIILLIALLTFNHISSFITIVIVFLGLILLGKDSENKDGLVMLMWILGNLIYLSYLNIKVNRYIIPTIAPLIYLTLAGLELIQEKIKINRNIIPIALIVLFVIQGFTFCMTFEETNVYKTPEEMSNFIINEIPDYEHQMIGVYNIRPYSWYLGENTTGIPNSDLTQIEESNVAYYISNTKETNLTDFVEIKNIDNLYLYKKNS